MKASISSGFYLIILEILKLHIVVALLVLAAVVLYKVEFANQEGFTDPSYTEELCSWSNSLKEIKPVKIKDMDIQEHNCEKEIKQYVIYK